MQKYKLVNFKREYSFELPYFSLNKEDSSWIISQMFITLGLGDVSCSNSLFFNFLNNNLKKELSYGNEFNFHDLIKIQLKNVKQDSVVFLVWDLESNVDLFTMENLVKYWDDVWYDTSDEAIALFFPFSQKVVLITDQGFIKTN